MRTALGDMSTDTEVIMWAISPQKKLRTIYDLLRTSENECFEKVTRYFGQKWLTKEWHFREEGTLFGPGGWVLDSSVNTVRIYHMTKFGSIDPKAEEGIAILDSINWFGKVIGSDKAIFTHELLPVKDTDFLESIADLRKEWEEAKSWEQMCRSNFFDNHCWFSVSLPLAIQ